VIGLVVHVNEFNSYVPFEALAQEIGKSNLGYRVDLVSDRHTADDQQRLVEDLREAYTANHIEVTWAWTSADFFLVYNLSSICGTNNRENKE